MEFQADQVRLPRADRPSSETGLEDLDGSAANPRPFPLAQNAPASASRSSKSLLNLGHDITCVDFFSGN